MLYSETIYNKSLPRFRLLYVNNDDVKGGEEENDDDEEGDADIFEDEQVSLFLYSWIACYILFLNVSSFVLVTLNCFCPLTNPNFLSRNHPLVC